MFTKIHDFLSVDETNRSDKSKKKQNSSLDHNPRKEKTSGLTEEQVLNAVKGGGFSKRKMFFSL